jgi:hypothetical protein
MIAALDQVELASARQCGARPSRIGGNGRKGKGVYKQESDRQAAADIGSDPPEIGKIATSPPGEPAYRTEPLYRTRVMHLGVGGELCQPTLASGMGAPFAHERAPHV